MKVAGIPNDQARVCDNLALGHFPMPHMKKLSYDEAGRPFEFHVWQIAWFLPIVVRAWLGQPSIVLKLLMN